MAWYDFWHTQKVLPASYDDSLSYYEVLCKVIESLKELAPLTEGLDERVTTAEASATAAENTAAQALSTATSAASAAQVATSTANTANDKAQSAAISAANAEAGANAAQTAAANAEKTANDAKTTVSGVSSTAIEAHSRAYSMLPFVDCNTTSTEFGGAWHYEIDVDGWQQNVAPQQFALFSPFVNGVQDTSIITVKFADDEAHTYRFTKSGTIAVGGYNWTGTPDASPIPHLVYFDLDRTHTDGGGVVIV